MTEETPADLLRRAATLLEEVAAKTTPGPWWASDTRVDGKHPNSPVVAVTRTGPPERVRGLFEADWGTEADAHWIALMQPRMAAALAAWLRDGADRCAESQARWEAGPEWLGGGDDDLPPKMTPEQVAANVEHHWRHELAVARALLKEDQP